MSNSLQDLKRAEEILQAQKEKPIEELSTWSMITPVVPTVQQVFANHLLYISHNNGQFTEVYIGSDIADFEITTYESLAEYCSLVGHAMSDFMNHITEVTTEEIGTVIKQNVSTAHKIFKQLV